MKKQQLAAMVLSALSAGILISCTKPNDKPSEQSASETSMNNADKQQNADSLETTRQASKDATTTADTKNATDTAIEIPVAETQAYLTHVANDKIIPAYKEVAAQSNELHEIATHYCSDAGTASSDAGLDTEKVNHLRKQWVELAKAWAAAEMVNFGPAMDNMSNLYINYYPDERGLVHQGVIELIDLNPNLTAEQLSAESAVIQGIPGMEEVLFANDTLNSAQCQYIMSASAALSHRLEDAHTKWQSDWSQLLGISDIDSADDSNNKLGMNRWINSLLSLVETTKGNALDKPLGLTGNKKGHLPASAAGQSKAIITAKVSAMTNALTDPELITILAENNQDTLADKMSTVLAETSALLAQMPDDIGEAKTAEQQALYDKLTELTRIVKRELMPLLGVQVGFNSTDGD